MGSVRGRPSTFYQALEFAKMTWSPVLEILGDPVMAEMDRVPYSPEPFHFSSGERIIRAELKRSPEHATVHWLSVPDVVRIHDDMIKEFRGTLGILNEGRIASTLDRAKNSEVYGHDPFPTIIHKAASIMHDILVYHPFADGQKRTGLSSAFIFLGLNGYSLWSRDPPDEVHFAIAVAKQKHDVEEITRWLADRVAPPTDLGESEIENLLKRIEPRVRQCGRCRRYLPIRSYMVHCRNCRATYKVLIRFGAVKRSRSGGREVAAKVGLIRIEDPYPVQVRLSTEESELLNREVRGEGGWNDLVRKLQSKLRPDGSMLLDSDEVARIRKYAMGHGPGGFQNRLRAVLHAINRSIIPNKG
jgi:death on curing protein